MVGRIMAPKDFHTLIPEPVNKLPSWQRELQI